MMRDLSRLFTKQSSFRCLVPDDIWTAPGGVYRRQGDISPTNGLPLAAAPVTRPHAFHH
jgi:hypothetical protein